MSCLVKKYMAVSLVITAGFWLAAVQNIEASSIRGKNELPRSLLRGSS